MTLALACIPLLSAFAGWMTIRLAIYFLFHPKKAIHVFNFRLQGVYHNKEKTLKAAIAALIKKELTESEQLTAMLASPANIEKLRPELEQHIDVFLKVKLKEAMPMIGMLIGDRTIHQLKSLFMQELETLFPSVMNSYVNHMLHDEGIDRMIASRLDAFDTERVEQLLLQNASEELRRLQWLAVFIGLLIGCLQLITIIFLLP
jgi:uncharacterized membrane protein YheB (UPF0754 family)